jgi:hypothetical protein
MKHTPSLWHIILVLLLIVTLAQPAACHRPVWDERLVPAGRVRRRYNLRRNCERWARRWARRRRRRPPVSRAVRRRHRARILRQILNANPSPVPIRQRKQWGSAVAVSERAPMEKPSPIAETASEPDPLADLRQARGWIDHMDERELWEMLICLRWPQGAQCPHCGERDPQYVRLIDADYHGGLGRWGCQVCAEAGDPGEGGTFTPLTGTLLDGMRSDVRTLWLIVEQTACSVCCGRPFTKRAPSNRWCWPPRMWERWTRCISRLA